MVILVFIIPPALFIVGSSTSTGSYDLMGLNNQFRSYITQHSAKVVEAQITVKFRTSNAKFIHTKGYTTNFIRVLSMIKTHIYALTFERTNKVIPRTRIYLRIKN